VRSALGGENVKIIGLAVTKMPRSGTSDQLLAFEEINAQAIVTTTKALLTRV